MSSQGELGNLGEPSVSLRTTRSGGPGDQRPWRRLGLPPGDEPGWDTTNSGSTHGIGERATSKGPREGQVAVVAAHSTEEGGEVRPKRPTGGKAPSGRVSTGGRQGRDFEITNPGHGRPVDCKRVAAALSEEPDACIAHVRVCGRAGWVTTGSTRQPTAPSGRLFPCGCRCLGAAAHRGR